jgi:hypothetical protein
LDKESARHRDLYLTTQTLYKTNIHAPVGFEPTIPASSMPQTYAVDRAASGIEKIAILRSENLVSQQPFLKP